MREKRFTEAANAFDQALTILERTLGPDNPELAPTMEHYAQILRMQQDFAKAASLDARVMKIRVTRTLKRAFVDVDKGRMASERRWKFQTS